MFIFDMNVPISLVGFLVACAFLAGIVLGIMLAAYVYNLRPRCSNFNSPPPDNLVRPRPPPSPPSPARR